MSEIEKIQRYIKRTKAGKMNFYQMDLREMLDLAHATLETPVEVVCLAFEYGRAKGWRAAKAAGRATV